MNNNFNQFILFAPQPNPVNKTERRIFKRHLEDVLRDCEYTRKTAIARYELHKGKVYTSSSLNRLLVRCNKKEAAARLLLDAYPEIEKTIPAPAKKLFINSLINNTQQNASKSKSKNKRSSKSIS